MKLIIPTFKIIMIYGYKSVKKVIKIIVNMNRLDNIIRGILLLEPPVDSKVSLSIIICRIPFFLNCCGLFKSLNNSLSSTYNYTSLWNNHCLILLRFLSLC